MAESSRRLGCAVICVWLGSTAFAAPEDFFELAPDQLSKLKVTAASAFAESELDSSATVSVVTRDDWQRRAARTLPDAVMHLPGVMLLSPPDGGLLIQVRSYDSTSLRGRATLVDGVPINTFAFGSEVFSNAELQLPVLDSLELVRGPSSIMYGSDAFHSALVLSTYHETQNHLEAEGETASRNYQRIAVRGTQTFAESQSLQLAVSVAHQGNQGDEYSYPLNGVAHNASREQSYHAGTGMLRWEGSGSVVGYQLEVLTDQTSVNEFPGAGTLISDVRDRDIADRNSHLWMIKGGLNGDLGDNWDWHWDNYYWRNDYGQDYWLFLGTYSLESQQIVEHRYGLKLNIKRADIEFLKAKTQLAATVGSERQAIDDHNVTTLVHSLLPQIPTPDYAGLEQGINSLSLEGKTLWQNGRYQVIYGGRLDDYSTFGSQTSPRAGFIWMPTGEYSVKALYGQAFRAPNANELRGTNFALGDADLKPETIDNYELSLTRAFSSGIVQLVGFKTRWNDRILLVNGRYTNAGESESKGVELSTRFDFDRWRFEVSASGISNHTISRPQGSGPADQPDMFPKWIADVGIGYRWPAQRLELFWANRLHENVRTGDDTQRGNVSAAGFFYRSDISLTQQWGANWTGQLALRNIFDKDNVWPSVVNSNGGIADVPRQISFEVRYRGLP
ncbi:MAG TPA: TonB-dependent receptor [Spongiibacteraceae bacterium]|nr:TonB-dependent receptor [Spongiibacteraceae bacterium]